ncbi:MAG: helicase HerA-like domain-containing protein [Chlamydiota bacterium]|nr:helicase HerA-like domain-containing protein [Chlamydiota bacterium]
MSVNTIPLGAAILNGVTYQGLHINIPLKTLNRHGLIAGATGTGKTKTVQGLAGALATKGVPVLLMDIKGDLSGVAKAGESHPKIEERAESIGLSFIPKEHTVEFLSLSDEKGVQLKATVSEFGPVLFSKMLGLNDIQSGVMALLFKYCDDHQLPLMDLKDVKKTLNYLTNEGKEDIQEEYGSIASRSVAAIIRKIIELEQQGADKFFGEKSFEVNDLVRFDEKGEGIISILRLTDIQNKPKLFSSFMLSLLAEVYSSFPEEGDLDQPKLVIFIDEAHLIFEEASKELLNQLEIIVKLIRSKGVGIFFCTQNPADIPADILGQLGLKVQHALRAFTAADRKKIKAAAENYPLTDYYKTDQLLTSLGIGQALITAISEKGTPTPLVATLLCAPDSRMGILTDHEISEIVAKSLLVQKYNRVIDSTSAYEILTEKIKLAQKVEEQERFQRQQEKILQSQRKSSYSKGGQRRQKSTLETVTDSGMAKQIGRTLVREITRGILGVLGLGGRSRR